MKSFFDKILGKMAPERFEEHEDSGVRNIQIAACALLLEMAGVDGKFSDAEQKRIVGILEKQFSLSAEEVTELLKSTRRELDNSIDLWRFTHLINQQFSREEKIGVIENVWRVVYTDGKLDKHEDYLVHKMAQLLNLTPSDLIQAKLRVLGK